MLARSCVGCGACLVNWLLVVAIKRKKGFVATERRGKQLFSDVYENYAEAYVGWRFDKD